MSNKALPHSELLQKNINPFGKDSTYMDREDWDQLL